MEEPVNLHQEPVQMPIDDTGQQDPSQIMVPEPSLVGDPVPQQPQQQDQEIVDLDQAKELPVKPDPEGEPVEPEGPPHPWDASNIIDFCFYCCPECDYKCKTAPTFHEHAVQSHPTAEKFFEQRWDANSPQSDPIASFPEWSVKNEPNDDETIEEFYEGGEDDFIPDFEDEDDEYGTESDEEYRPEPPKRRKKGSKVDHSAMIPNIVIKTETGNLDEVMERFYGEGSKPPPAKPKIKKVSRKKSDSGGKVDLLSPDEKVGSNGVEGDTEEKPFACPRCDDRYGRLYGLAMHLLCCHQVGKPGCHPCPSCSYVGQKMNLLKKHIAEVHEGSSPTKSKPRGPAEEPGLVDPASGSVKPEYGDEDEYGDDTDTKTRIILPESTPIHDCTYCSMKFRGLPNLAWHLGKAHSIGGNGDRRCPRCDFSARKMGDLRSHIDREHEPDNALCTVCNKAVKRKALRMHIKYHEEKASNKVFACTEEGCTYSTNTSSGLNNHKRNKHAPHLMKIQCDECGKCFHYKSNLAAHRAYAHQPNKFVCETCGKSFPFENLLRSHEKSHVWTKQDKTYTCDLCPESFPHLRSYITHYQQYHKRPFPDNVDRTNLELYYCDECTNVYTRPVSLKRHKRIVHEGQTDTRVEKRAMDNCPHCDKVVQRGHKMTEHIKSKHEMDTPFKCPECPKSFGTSLTLRSHIHQSHRRTNCPVCNKEICNNFWLKRHLAKEHGVIPDNCVQCDVCPKVFDTVKAKEKHQMKEHG